MTKLSSKVVMSTHFKIKVILVTIQAVEDIKSWSLNLVKKVCYSSSERHQISGTRNIWRGRMHPALNSSWPWRVKGIDYKGAGYQLDTRL